MINNYKKNEQLKMDKFGVFKFILENSTISQRQLAVKASQSLGKVNKLIRVVLVKSF